MPTRFYPLLALAVLLVVGTFAGCDSADTDGAPGTFRVLLTDAPGDFLHAVVTIESVYLQGSDSDADSDGEGGRVILRDDPVTVDLLTLQNEVLDLVDGVEVPSGRYAQLRLVISGGYIEVEREGGATEVYASSEAYAAAQGVTADGELQMPSFDASGLKITLPEGTAEVDGDQHILLIDFDVAESFGQQAGQSGRWVLRPVIRATDFGLTGRADLDLRLGPDVDLPGDVLTLAEFSASLDKGGDVVEVAFEDPDGDGTFTAPFLYLAPGSYALDVIGPEGIVLVTDPAFPFAVSVESGGTTRETVTILSIAGG